jgi:hypothetical protein
VPPWTPEPADDTDYAGPTKLGTSAGITGEELLALQLAARGYSLAQIAHLTEAHDAGGAVALLRRAAEALGAADAVAEARRRGLIV